MFNISFKLAFASLTKRPKKIRPLVILTFIITTLSSLAFGLLDNFSNARTQVLMKEYGSWKYAVQNIDYETAIHFQENYDDIYLAYHIDNLVVHDKTYTVFSIDTSLKEVISMNLIEGHYPKNENEITLTYEVLNALNPSLKVGDSILLNNKSYILSGILSDFAYIRNLEFPSIIVKSNSIKSVDLYSKNSKLIGYDISPNGDFVSNGYIMNSSMETVYIVAYYGTIFLLVVLVCITAMSSSLMNDRLDEFSLLKGLGATSYQINMMIIFESALLSILVIPIGLLLGELIHFLILFFYDISIYSFSYSSLLLIGFIIYLVVLFGTYLPYNKAARHILSGNFRFRHKMFRAAKINGKISSFKLGLRMLTNKFSICFFFFILLFVTFNKIIGILDLYTLTDIYEESINYIENDYTVVLNGNIYSTDRTSLNDHTESINENELDFIKNIGINKVHLLPYNNSRYYIYEQSQLTHELILEMEYNYKSYPTESKYYSHPRVFSVEEDSIYYQSILSVGRLPKKENEIVLFLPSVDKIERIYGHDLDYDYLLKNESTIEVGQNITMNIAYNQLTLDNEHANPYIHDTYGNGYRYKHDRVDQYQMNIVGIIYYEEFEYVFSNYPAILLHSDLFNALYNSKSVITLFDCQDKHQFQQLTSYLLSNNRSILDVNLKRDRLYDYIELNETNFNDELIETIVTVIAVLFIFIYINYYQVQASHELFGLLRVNGASFKDIQKMYICQSLTICFMALIFSHYFVLYDLFVSSSYLMQSYPIMLHILAVIVLVVLITIAYCLPLKKLETFDIISLIRFKE